MRRSTALASLLAAGALALLAWGPALAPPPPLLEIRYGAREVLSKSLSDRIPLRVPGAGVHEIALSARCLAAVPCRIVARLHGTSAGEAPREANADVPSTAFVDVPLFASPPLEAVRTYEVELVEATGGVIVDRIEIRNRTSGWAASIEAEDGHLSPSSVVVLDATASGGAGVGTLEASRENETLTQTFVAEEDGLEGVMLGGSSGWSGAGDESETVRFVLRSERDGRILLDRHEASARLARDEFLRLSFPSIDDSKGRRFSLTIAPAAGRRLPFMTTGPGYYAAGTLTLGRTRTTSSLLFAPRYANAWTKLAWVALVLMPLLVLSGFRSSEAGRIALGLLLPLVLLVSVANWQREYQFRSGFEWMPDGYDGFAQHVSEFLKAPGRETWKSLDTFLSLYPHAHNPVVPVLTGIGESLGLSLPRAYLAVSFLFTLGGAWALLALLERVSGGVWPAAWAGTCLGLTHFLFLKGAVRTSTDAGGYATVILALLLGTILAEGSTSSSTSRGFSWLLAATVLACTLALYTRPTALPLSMAIGAGFVLRRLFLGDPRRGTLGSGALLAFAPLAMFFGGVYTAGFGGSFGMVRAEVAGFASAREPWRYAACLAVLVQLLWLPTLPFVAGLGRRLRTLVTWGPATVGAVWLAAFLGFLALSPAPFWNRYFLHALVGLLVVLTPATAALHRVRPRWFGVWFGLHVAVNLGYVAFTIFREAPFGPNYILN